MSMEQSSVTAVTTKEEQYELIGKMQKEILTVIGRRRKRILENIFKIGLIIVDAIVIATTDNKVSKIAGVIAILFLGISFLG